MDDCYLLLHTLWACGLSEERKMNKWRQWTVVCLKEHFKGQLSLLKGTNDELYYIKYITLLITGHMKNLYRNKLIALFYLFVWLILNEQGSNHNYIDTIKSRSKGQKQEMSQQTDQARLSLLPHEVTVELYKTPRLLHHLWSTNSSVMASKATVSVF